MHRQKGFSLVELAVVILIMGLVLGGLAMPLSVQRENARIAESRSQLDDIQDAVEGFAMVNGHLPCPATPASAGRAAASAGGCSSQHGFVPATSLDLRGARNGDNLLLDPWGSPLRYSVSSADVDGDGLWDFTSPGEMRDVTMPLLAGDIVVCSSAAGASATSCASGNLTLTDRAPLVVYSMGKDWSSFTSADQLENAGANVGGGPSGSSYRIANDRVFVSRGPSAAAGNEFDDQVAWTSSPALLRRLVDTGHLP
jgi:prepilin-type N-terminal cleavage/methylation domain-containing protein